MQEQFDKQLADKIRQELEGYEPPFESGHWADMQKRLGRKTNNYTKRIFAIGVATLLVGVFYLPLGEDSFSPANLLTFQESALLKSETDHSIDSVELASLVQPNSREGDLGRVKVAEETSSIASTNKSGLKNEIASMKVEDTENDFLEKEETILKGISKGNSKEKELITATQDNSIGASKLTEESISQNKIVNQSELSSIESSIVKEEKKEIIPAEVIESEEMFIEGKKDKMLLSLKNIDVDSKPFYLDSISPQTTFIPAEQKFTKGLQQVKRLHFSILAEGFMNQNNRVNNYRKPGFGFGILANYRIHPKINLTSGLVFKKMHGKAFPDQTQFEQEEASFNLAAFPGFGTNSISDFAESSQEKTNLVTITAHLTAIEIPIQVSYYLSKNSRRRFYINGGVASYFYLNERYEFEKEEFQLPAQANTRKLSIVNEEVTYGSFEKFDFVSTFSVAVGMEKNIGVYSSVGVEPFWSFPIFNMGQENIPIYSTGIRLKYNFGR